MNSLKKEMPLAGGGKWEEGKLLVLLSVPNPQSEQKSLGFFPGIRRYQLCIMRGPSEVSAVSSALLSQQPGQVWAELQHKGVLGTQNMAKG